MYLAVPSIPMPPMTAPRAQGDFRPIVRMIRPTSARHGDVFTALRMGASAFGADGDPFLNLDHFRMAGPTFPPHAHAGFSAVTYVLPESDAGMSNRDSLGDRSIIPPGGLHWTAAGSGIVHEEVPERAGALVEGFQIFVRQPVAQETLPPAIDHVDPAAVPVVALEGGCARILAGRYDGTSAPFGTPSPLALIDVMLERGACFAWSPVPEMTSCAVYLFEGALDAGDRPIAAPMLILFERGDAPVQIAAKARCRFLLLAGEPLHAPSVSNGPFVLSSQDALDEAMHRYRSGAMGTLH
jgi:redox-sensitive bicupin YhaK (pirin superfamily)